MKKLIPLFLIFCGSLFYSPSQAQDQTIAGGSLLINAGVGYGYDYGFLGNFYPAVMVSVDDILTVNAGPGTIGVGGIFGAKFGSYSSSYFYYDSYGDPVYYDYSNTYSEFILAARAIYHWTPPGAKGLDLYAGVPLGIRIEHYSIYDPYYSNYYGTVVPAQTSGSSSYPFLGLFIGAAYYFNPGFGVYAELGYDVSALSVGVSFKVK